MSSFGHFWQQDEDGIAQGGPMYFIDTIIVCTLTATILLAPKVVEEMRRYFKYLVEPEVTSQ